MQYNTEQRKILLELLHSHEDETLSALSIIDILSRYNISKSAVYRNLADLEKDGKIRRVSRPNERIAYYQYIDDDHCKGKIHISCINCGKTSHLSSDSANSIVNTLINQDEFSLDNNETILYGICKDCKYRKNKVK